MACRRKFAALFLGLMFLSGSVACAGDADNPPVLAAYRRLARTMNVDTQDLDVESRHLDAIKVAGFTALRLAVNWTKHCGNTAPYNIDPEFMQRVDRVVDQALARRLAIIIDYHVDKGLMSDPAAYRERFLSLWSQISDHFRDTSGAVLFEPMAEPHYRLDAVWTACFAEVLAVIRRSNPDRTVLVGPSYYNSVSRLDDLKLPPDPNLIVCIHTYRPIQFTFQGVDFLPGARKWLGTRWTGLASEQEEIRKDYDKMAQWSNANGRPVFVEEFGTTGNADPASRARWVAFNRKEAEARGFSWGFWSFGPTSFGIYDLENEKWDPALLAALIPGKTRR